ncbi:MAG: taurine ABC transporter permease [Betaproteobacteria bacterium]|nr:taurine ABC transporter permease [Betaproteobacteria bacterium]
MSLLSRRTWFLFLAALTCTCLAGTTQAQQTKIRFILDWRFEGPSALFLLPKAKKYFEQEGLDVTVDSGTGSGAAVNRVASGAYEMGFADLPAMIEFLASNQTNPAARMQAVYMLYDVTPAAVFALKKSGIAKPADLNGKTMGAPVFDAGRRAFPAFVKANNLDSKRIKWQSMDPALRETMLARGDVDAITGFYFTSLINLNARGVKDEDIVVLKYPEHGVRMYSNTVIASQKFINENPKAVAGFLRALTKGIREVIADPEGAMQYVKERDPLINVPMEGRRTRLAIDMAIATPDFKSNGIGAINKVKFEDTVAQVVQAFELKVTPNTDTLFNSSFLPSKSERQVFSK